MVKRCPLAIAGACEARRAKSADLRPGARKKPKLEKKTERDKSPTYACLCASTRPRRRRGEKIPDDLRSTVMADCICQAERQRRRRSWLQLFLTVFSRESDPQLSHLTTAKESWVLRGSGGAELGFLPPRRGAETGPRSEAVALPSAACGAMAVRRHKEKEPYSPC